MKRRRKAKKRVPLEFVGTVADSKPVEGFFEKGPPKKMAKLEFIGSGNAVLQSQSSPFETISTVQATLRSCASYEGMQSPPQVPSTGWLPKEAKSSLELNITPQTVEEESVSPPAVPVVTTKPSPDVLPSRVKMEEAGLASPSVQLSTVSSGHTRPSLPAVPSSSVQAVKDFVVTPYVEPAGVSNQRPCTEPSSLVAGIPSHVQGAKKEKCVNSTDSSSQRPNTKPSLGSLAQRVKNKSVCISHLEPPKPKVASPSSCVEKVVPLATVSSDQQPRTKTALVQSRICLPKTATIPTWQLNVAEYTAYAGVRDLEVDHYPKFFGRSDARSILKQLEKDLPPYLKSSELKIMGKVHKIPRKQAAFGDSGLSYHFSGVTVPAHTWIPVLERIRNRLVEFLREDFNFVLVNCYKDGHDHIGEHRDDERDLVSESSIACLSFGQERDFILKHKDFRGKDANKDIPMKKSRLKVSLEHGSLLVMKFPTNRDWYHSLPIRKSVTGKRISLTFRVMKTRRPTQH